MENMYRMTIVNEDDVYLASALGKKIAENCGFSKIEQSKIVVSIMELTRNIVLYAQKGELLIRSIQYKGIEIVAIDEGSGIENLNEIMSEKFHSKTGLGLGLLGVKRLMDDFEIITIRNKGTKVRAFKYFHENQGWHQ